MLLSGKKSRLSRDIVRFFYMPTDKKKYSYIYNVKKILKLKALENMSPIVVKKMQS